MSVCVSVREKRKGNKLSIGSEKKAIFEYDEEREKSKCLTYVKLPTKNTQTHTIELRVYCSIEFSSLFI